MLELYSTQALAIASTAKAIWAKPATATLIAIHTSVIFLAALSIDLAMKRSATNGVNW